MKNILRNRSLELARILDVEDYTTGDGIIKKVTEIKNENRKLNGIIENLNGENIYGAFLKLVNSNSYYAKNKEFCDGVFHSVIQREKLALMSADVITGEKDPRFVFSAISGRFSKMGLSYLEINDIDGKNIYFIGFNGKVSINDIIKLFEFTHAQIQKAGYSVLINFSREFSDISGIFEAYKDIKVCRDYRGFGDSSTIMTVDKISFNHNIFTPINFTDELKSIIMEGNEKQIREYMTDVFNANLKNGVPVIKFDHLLRMTQNVITDAVIMLNSDPADIVEMEQMFIQRIDRMKATFDIEAIVNSFINILRFSLAGVPEKKKGSLNRRDVIKYINVHYTEDLYLEKLASEFGTTPKYFSNWFKREFSLGFSEYLAGKRITQAKKILCETEFPLGKVGEKSGYSNPVTFAVAFKKHTGMPPGKYRELNKKGNDNNEK